jgi:hypothetical protein
MVIRLYYGNSFPITKKGAQVLNPFAPPLLRPIVKCGSDKKPIACPAIPTLQLCWLATNGTQESKIFRRFLRKIFFKPLTMWGEVW